MNRLVRKVFRRAARTRPALAITMLIDDVLARRALISRKREDCAVIVPTAGNGNIGDEALLESVLQNAGESRKVVLLASRESFPADLIRKYGAEVKVLDGLFGDGLSHVRAFRSFLTTISAASSLYVVGADVMDGGYSPREAVLRFSLLRAGETAGLRTTLTGFSWNGRASQSVISAVGKLRRTRLLTRDPLSYARFNAISSIRAVDASDIVFSLVSENAKSEGMTWAQRQRSIGRRVAIVNASGLLLANRNLPNAYVLAIESLLARDYAIVLLPHVVREGDSDIQALDQLYSLLPPSDRVHLIREKLIPSQVFALAQEASICITARMHLSIIALSKVVPCIVVETQGKVRGLLRLFDLEFALIDLDGTVADKLLSAIRTIEDNRTEISAAIESALPEVQRKSKLNFVELL